MQGSRPRLQKISQTSKKAIRKELEEYLTHVLKQIQLPQQEVLRLKEKLEKMFEDFEFGQAAEWRRLRNQYQQWLETYLREKFESQGKQRDRLNVFKISTNMQYTLIPKLGSRRTNSELFGPSDFRRVQARQEQPPNLKQTKSQNILEIGTERNTGGNHEEHQQEYITQGDFYKYQQVIRENLVQILALKDQNSDLEEKCKVLVAQYQSISTSYQQKCQSEAKLILENNKYEIIIETIKNRLGVTEQHKKRLENQLLQKEKESEEEIRSLKQTISDIEAEKRQKQATIEELSAWKNHSKTIFALQLDFHEKYVEQLKKIIEK